MKTFLGLPDQLGLLLSMSSCHSANWWFCFITTGRGQNGRQKEKLEELGMKESVFR